MVKESSPLLPRAEESIEAETDAAREAEPESGEPAPEPISEPGFVCDCEEWMRSACKALAFYKEYESRRYCVLHYPGKEKSADFKSVLDSKLNSKDFDFRGVWFPDAVDFQGFEFTAAADFNSATFSAEAYFFSATFSAEADFSFATFSAEVSFSDATFSAAAGYRDAKFSADVYFISAKFSAAASFSNATFNADAYFSRATFSADAYFSDATFSADASFSYATFSADASFSYATFSADASFSYATFSADADLNSATFKSASNFDRSIFHANVSFRQASFSDSLRFFGSPTKTELPDGETLHPMSLGKEPSLDFQHVNIEHPERVAFHTLILRPHWFVNADPRLFQLTDVDWQWERLTLRKEIAALENVESPSRIRLLLKACRQLAENAEANNRYEEASRLRYWAMDLARRTKWRGWAFWKTDWLHMLYWAVSGYGERILRAFGVLAAVWLVFALLYTRVGFVPLPPKLSDEGESMRAMIISIQEGTGQPLAFSRALTYSLAVMSLQKPDPKPFTGTAQTLVLLETILGPVQAALLALAIRRKFMR